MVITLFLTYNDIDLDKDTFKQSYYNNPSCNILEKFFNVINTHFLEDFICFILKYFMRENLISIYNDIDLD